MPLFGRLNNDGPAKPTTEYDARDALEFYGGNGDRAVNGLMRRSYKSLEYAVDSARRATARRIQNTSRRRSAG